MKDKSGYGIPVGEALLSKEEKNVIWTRIAVMEMTYK